MYSHSVWSSPSPTRGNARHALGTMPQRHTSTPEVYRDELVKVEATLALAHRRSGHGIFTFDHAPGSS